MNIRYRIFSIEDYEVSLSCNLFFKTEEDAIKHMELLAKEREESEEFMIIKMYRS